MLKRFCVSGTAIMVHQLHQARTEQKEAIIAALDSLLNDNKIGSCQKTYCLSFLVLMKLLSMSRGNQ
jgi:hypothetical protein